MIAIDEEGVERLIDEESYYVAYDENGVQYKVNRSGEKIVEVVVSPFLDDDGNPITDEQPSEIEVSANAEETKKSKKKKADSAE